ncbi:hypothetical protein [Duncaniella freteri]|uniref:hypothetical protein n=1 Tax=Duncaniella freteri TaxID=2530391 RepID=UPI003F677181
MTLRRKVRDGPHAICRPRLMLIAAEVFYNAHVVNRPFPSAAGLNELSMKIPMSTSAGSS